MNTRDKRLKALFLTFFLALLLFSVGFLVSGYIRGYFNSADSLRDYIGSFGALAPLILIAIQTMQAFLPVIPTFLATGAINCAIVPVPEYKSKTVLSGCPSAPIPISPIKRLAVS